MYIVCVTAANIIGTWLLLRRLSKTSDYFIKVSYDSVSKLTVNYIVPVLLGELCIDFVKPRDEDLDLLTIFAVLSTADLLLFRLRYKLHSFMIWRFAFHISPPVIISTILRWTAHTSLMFIMNAAWESMDWAQQCTTYVSVLLIFLYLLNVEMEVIHRLVQLFPPNFRFIAQTYECSICLESLKEVQGVCGQNCDHAYHLHCLTQWCQISHTCPYCRVDLCASS